jgi:DNA polymerase (family 10)
MPVLSLSKGRQGYRPFAGAGARSAQNVDRPETARCEWRRQGVMDNRRVADILYDIADMLEIKGEIIYKAVAYRRAADNILNLGRDIEDVWRDGELREIPGVGEALAKKLDELLRTGRLGYYEGLKEEVPRGVVDMLAVPDIGPKTARLLYEKLGLTSVVDVERAAREGKLRDLPGLGAKSEANILEGIEALRRRGDHIFSRALPSQ